MSENLKEKRRYFRVNDTINLVFKVISEQQIQQHSHVSNNVLGSCSLSAALEVLSHETAALAPRLERRDPEMFEYLKLLDSKINLIAESLSPQQNEFSERDKRDVSLSAAGVAFMHDEAIAVGTLLEMQMFLTSCLAIIIAYGRVVQCKTLSVAGQQQFAVCVEYINMHEEDRELLIKHVIKKQMQQLRDKNANV